MTESLIGIFEIAELSNVSPSAVANWRKRFSDFPAPLVDLKSGPVFSENQVKLWLARRQATDSVKRWNCSMTSSQASAETIQNCAQKLRK